MNAITQQAVEHWQYVAPLLTPPQTTVEFNRLVEALDELLDTIGDQEDHPLAGLVHRLGDLVSAYEQQYIPMPTTDGRSTLSALMQMHGLGQCDLADIAPQSVISEIISGKRQLNIRHIKALAARFNVSADTFLA
ncbi:MAG: helix-turn-helix domain-containing protein [Moraxellaceae bacterium]